MSEREFLRLFWKIAKRMKLDKNVIDVVIVRERDWDLWGYCSRILGSGDKISKDTKAIVYFKSELLESARPFVIEVIVEELTHITLEGHGEAFLKVFVPTFKRLKYL